MLRRFTTVAACLFLLPLAVAAQQPHEIPVSTASAPAGEAFQQAERHLDVGRTDRARAAFRRAVELDPEFTYAWLGLANAAQSPGEFRNAMERAAATAPGKSEGEQLLLGINETFLSADTDRRLELAEEIVAAYPRSPRARLAHGFALQSVDRHAEARLSFSRAVELAPEMYAAHAALGFSHLFNEPRSPANAVVHMEHCVSLSPEEAKAHEAVGDAYRAYGDLAGARDAYSKALQLDPKLGVASLKKGHVNSFLGNYEEARRDYDAGVDDAVGPNRFTYANYRAFIHVHAERPEAAIRELREIAENAASPGLDANDRYSVQIFTLTNAAAIALHHGLSTQSREVLGDRARLMMAESERLGDVDFARRQEADIQLWSARAAARWGDHDLAEKALATHVRLLEPDADPTRLQGYHLVRGLIALRQGLPQRAVLHLRQADPDDQYAKYHLAVALEAAGRHEEPRRLFTEVAGFNFNSVDYALVRRDALEREG